MDDMPDAIDSYIEGMTIKQLGDALIKSKKELTQSKARIRELEEGFARIISYPEVWGGWKSRGSAKLERLRWERLIEIAIEVLSDKSNQSDKEIE